MKQHTATHCNTLQHTTTHCITLQHSPTHALTIQRTRKCETARNHQPRAPAQGGEEGGRDVFLKESATLKAGLLWIFL